MRKDEVVKKNISLAFDFLRYLTDHPELIKRLPDGCELEFLDADFPLILHSSKWSCWPTTSGDI